MITRESDYAIRLVRGLSDGKKHSAAELAESQDVTKPFAYKILKKLHQAGVVKIIRGKEGGYILDADLDELTLLDFLKVTENELWVNECVEPGAECQWRDHQTGQLCHVHQHLQRLQNTLTHELERYSIREILTGTAQYSPE